jgi:hypothetical protein
MSRRRYPVDPFSTDVESPEQTASVANYFSYGWITRLVTIAWKRDVEIDDFDPLPDYDRARLWFSKYELSKKSSALKTMFALFRWDFLYMTLFSFAVGVCQVGVHVYRTTQFTDRVIVHLAHGNERTAGIHREIQDTDCYPMGLGCWIVSRPHSDGGGMARIYLQFHKAHHPAQGCFHTGAPSENIENTIHHR